MTVGSYYYLQIAINMKVKLLTSIKLLIKRNSRCLYTERFIHKSHTLIDFNCTSLQIPDAKVLDDGSQREKITTETTSPNKPPFHTERFATNR